MPKLLEATREEINWAQQIAAFARAHGDSNSATEIDLAIKEYSQRKIAIAVVGLNKRGKSTFCNALLGRKDDMLAPVDWEPATGVVSRFAFSRTEECAYVYFENGQKEKIAYDHIRKYVLEKENPENGKGVEYVEVLGNFDLDEDIELLDLPGDDSIYAYHSQIVNKYLPNADVVLFLSSATDPIHKTELELLNKINENDRKKIFFIINKADDCDEDELAEAQQHDAEVLQNAGIFYEKKFFCISAKQMLQSGTDAFEFNELVHEIQSFLYENKLGLQREGFRNVVKNAILGLREKLKIQADASQISEEELQQRIEEFKIGYAKAKEMLNHGLKEFSETWNFMISDLENQLPNLKEETRVQVREFISSIPITGFSKKVKAELPVKMNEIMSQIMQKPLAQTEASVKAALEKLEKDVKEINKVLVDSSLTISITTQSQSYIGSVIASSTFISLGALLMKIVAIPAAATGIPVVGSALAAIGGVATAPLAVLAAPLFVGGGLFLTLPVLGWVKGKNFQKKQIMLSADNSIVQAFATIQSSKLPMLKQKGDILVLELKDSLQHRMNEMQQGLNDALNKKQNLLENRTTTIAPEVEYRNLNTLLEYHQE